MYLLRRKAWMGSTMFYHFTCPHSATAGNSGNILEHAQTCWNKFQNIKSKLHSILQDITAPGQGNAIQDVTYVLREPPRIDAAMFAMHLPLEQH